VKPAADRIYIRAPNWVGDAVMATPIFQAVRDAFPRARITIGMRPHLEAVVRGAKFFDALHFVPARPRLSEIRKIAAEIRTQQFDAAILLPNSFETALVAAMARIPRRFGYAQNGRGALLTDSLRAPSRWLRRIPEPMPEYWSRLVALAGVDVRSTRPRLEVDDATVAEFESWLRNVGIGPNDKFLLVAPGASFGSSKLWRSDRFAEVADALARSRGLKTIVQFGPGEEAIAREVANATKTGAILAADPPLDLHRLKAAARRCELLVCTDSGVRHYGVAFGKPVVCVMGPNDPRYTNSNIERTRVVREEVECGPCQLKVCPLDHRCMENLHSSRVVEAAHELLA
jgi:heptosyltransferase-2